MYESHVSGREAVPSPLHRILVPVLAVLFSAFAFGAAHGAEQLGDLTGPWQLFVDDHLVAESSQLSRVWHAFEKHAGNPLLRADQAWEGAAVYLYGTVLPREDGTGYRMWYHAYDGDYRMLYATSDDGLAWSKPALGLTGFRGSAENNILFQLTHENHNPQVIHTPWEGDPQRRYKMIYFEYGRTPPVSTVTGYRGAYSPDGIRWTECADNPVLVDSPGDVGNFVWDPLGKRYLGYPKKFEEVRGFRRRCVAFSSTTAFESWPESTLILTPDEYDDRLVADADAAGAHTDFYGLCGFAYETMYLGFLWMFPITDGKNDGPIFVELVSSRDGVHWRRQDEPRAPILPLGPAGAWDDGMVFTPNHPLVEGGTIKLYYGGFDGTHGGDANAAIGLATLRKDGFVSMRAGGQAGALTTPLLENAAGPLRVNFAARPDGWLRVELRDASGEVIPGYSETNCDVLTGDHTEHAVTWNGNSALPAGPVRLRFILRNAELFAFAAGNGVTTR